MGPTKIYIDHNNLIHNIGITKKMASPAKIMAVIKADAYGHGMTEVAKTLVANGVEYLGVAFPEEGVQLRQAGIKNPILVLGAQIPEYFEQNIQYDLDTTITGMHQLEPLRKICVRLNKKARVHIKIDTGMNRLGFSHEKFMDLADEFFNQSWMEITGIYSHFSSSDEDDLHYSLLQMERFNKIVAAIKDKSGLPILSHMANSGAIMRIPEAKYDMVRPGIMLHGNAPSNEFKMNGDFKEVMRFVSAVSAIKKLGPGQPVSYNRRYHTKEETRIAVIPAGYADGYNRGLSNKGSVLIKGRRYPIIGSVCMDQFVVEIGLNSDIQIGEETVLIGSQGGDRIRVEEVARQIGTIPYEVTCSPSRRVPRIHLYNSM
ncbi:MAG: alanine racemase [Calditrichaceae bacterium]